VHRFAYRFTGIIVNQLWLYSRHLGYEVVYRIHYGQVLALLGMLVRLFHYRISSLSVFDV
jgi:hypothetical protein